MRALRAIAGPDPSAHVVVWCSFTRVRELVAAQADTPERAALLWESNVAGL
jgi:hypothetical protein